MDNGYASILNANYWMPIHFDTIKDEQTKNLIFYSSNSKPSAINSYMKQVRFYAAYFLYFT